MTRSRISAAPLALAALAALAACGQDTTTTDPLPVADCRVAFARPVEVRALAIAADAEGELHVLAEEAAILELDRGPLSTIAAYTWIRDQLSFLAPEITWDLAADARGAVELVLLGVDAAIIPPGGRLESIRVEVEVPADLAQILGAPTFSSDTGVILVVDRPYEALVRADASPCPEGV